MSAFWRAAPGCPPFFPGIFLKNVAVLSLLACKPLISADYFRFIVDLHQIYTKINAEYDAFYESFFL